MSTRIIDTAPSAPALRPAGVALLAAGAVTVLGGLAWLLVDQGAPDGLWRSPFSPGAFALLGVSAAVSHLLVAWVAARLRDGAPARARTGLLVAIAAMVLMTALELAGVAIGGQSEESGAATAIGAGFGVGTVLFAVGTIVAGVALARAGRPQGRAVLVVGVAIVPLVVLAPSDLFGLGIALWGIGLLWAGAALAR
jgi:hypothetical protein